MNWWWMWLADADKEMRVVPSRTGSARHKTRIRLEFWKLAKVFIHLGGSYLPHPRLLCYSPACSTLEKQVIIFTFILARRQRICCRCHGTCQNNTRARAETGFDICTRESCWMVVVTRGLELMLMMLIMMSKIIPVKGILQISANERLASR